MRIGLPLLLASFAVSACTGEPPKDPAPSEIAGTKVSFDLDADLADELLFYRFPYPSDLRLTAEGRPDLRGFPNFQDATLVTGLTETAALRRAFPVMPVAFFELSAPPAPQDINTVIPAETSSPILLVDVDSRSPQRGRLHPVMAHTPNQDDYVPENFLTVAARPGIVLRPDTTYAFVVMRSLGDGDHNPLGIPLALQQMKAGQVPSGARGAAANTLYAPLWSTLREIGVSVDDVAGATVFTTGNAVEELAALTDGLKQRHVVEIAGLELQPVWGTRDASFCSLSGTVTLPQFQKGEQPFNTEGLFEFAADGLPVQQGEMTVPIVITLPRRAMPEEGYPLVLYIHGSGGTSDEAVNAGPAPTPLGELEPGKGPADTVARYGVATACSAMPVNPERLPGASSYAYLNLSNPSAMRDTFRQGVIEQRLYLEALRGLRIPAAMLESCTGASLPQGATDYRFDDDKLAGMGQSMGAWYTNMLSSVEPRISAIVPTGSGGYLSYFVLQTKIIDGVAGFLSLAVATLEPLTFQHPAMHMLDTACEAADPLVHLARIARRPLAGHPARSIYEPAGYQDLYFPYPVYDAMALAFGNEQAGSEVWPSMQEALSLDGRQGFETYPVHANRTSEDGRTYTGVVVQYAPDDVDRGHFIYRQRPEVRSQVGCFIDSWVKTGLPSVIAPATPGEPCGG